MIRVHKKGCMGLYDRNGKEIVAPEKFADIGKFCGYLSEHGHVAFYKSDVAPFCSAENGKYGVIDRTGKIVVEPKYYVMDDFAKNGLARAKLDNHKCVFIDPTGKVVFEQPDVSYCGAFSHSSDYAEITVLDGDTKKGLIDKTGKIVVEPKFDEIEWHPFIFSDLAYVMLNGKFGSIDKTGKIVIEPKYEGGYGFYPGEDLTRVILNDKVGYIDRTCEMVIEPKYDVLSREFGTKNYTQVCINDKWGVIDKTGKTVVDRKYQSAVVCSNDYFILTSGDKDGLVSSNLDTILDFQYDDITSIPGTENVLLTWMKIKRKKYEFGLYSNGKHTILKDIDDVKWMIDPYTF